MIIRTPEAGAVLRQAARRYATGVTVVALRHGDDAHALTANSFVTLSLKPPLIGIAVRADGRMRHLTESVRWFGVSVLSGEQEDYAVHYADRRRTATPPHLALLIADNPQSPPLVPGCVAHFTCELREIHAVGDHDLLVGEVTGCGVSDVDVPPLVFLDGKFQTPA